MIDAVPELAVEPVEPPPDLPLRASEDIQGNILAGFLKDHQTFLFLHFPDTARAKAYIAELTPRIATTKQVTTFNAQFSNARRLRGGDDPQNLQAVWINIGLTHHGLLTLEPNLASDLAAFGSFSAGPLAQAEQLGDVDLSAPSRWVVGRQDQQPVDAIITVAADEDADLLLELDKQRALATKHGLVLVFEQRGDTLPDQRAGHEHFGFKDGISQPGVTGFHPEHEVPDGNGGVRRERVGHPGTEMIAAGEFVLGHENESGGAAPIPLWMQDGSFQVWRRLSQDVPSWWSQVTRNRQSLPSDDPMTEDQLAAKLVGRWRSGTPLDHAPDRDNRSERDRERDNDFRFDNDPVGLKTPRAAHIRKMYPRDARIQDKMHRIMRRGIPFGATFDPTAGRGHGVDADRGLIFNVFQASIENQFEFLQQAWANFAQFPSVAIGEDRTDGPDGVIGNDPQPFEIRREGQQDEHLDFRRFVHTTGAVYAFAPSMRALRQLSGEFQLGDQAFVRAGGWRLRAQPNLQGQILAVLQANTQVTILEGPRSADGHQWWRVRPAAGGDGWIAGGGLAPQPVS